MKNRMLMLLVMVLFSVTCASAVSASDHGCRVLMCISNPAGPTAVSECVPTIDKLKSDMAKPGFSFPKCEEAESGGSRAVPSSSRYELCPDGFVELPRGVVALKDADYKKAVNPPKYITAKLHGERSGFLEWNYSMYFISKGDDGDNTDYIICGKGGSGSIDIAKSYTDREGDIRHRVYENAVIYEEIALAKAIRASMVVDVYIDNKLYQRIPLNL